LEYKKAYILLSLLSAWPCGLMYRPSLYNIRLKNSCANNSITRAVIYLIIVSVYN